LDTEIDGENEKLLNGELLVYGRHVFMGYLNDPAKTAACFHSSGYLHTGDTIRVDENDYLFISGRIKELIITAGGENIAPVPIEDNLKIELPQLISNCMVVGDKRKYLTVLVTLKTIVDLDTMLPSDELTSECIEYLKSIGSTSTRLSQIIKNNNADNKCVYEQIEQGKIILY
jgi:long-chain-fatty-acid--CoA ligase ACSBG